MRCELPDEEWHGTRCGSVRQQGHLMRHDHHHLAHHNEHRPCGRNAENKSHIVHNVLNRAVFLLRTFAAVTKDKLSFQVRGGSNS